METEVGTGLRAAWRSLCGRADVLTVVGGLAPPEVVSAEVEEADGRRRAATIGDGAWVIVLPGEAPFAMPAVAFRDLSGAIVGRPPPPGVQEPVSDADEPCPSCAGRRWSLVHAAPADAEGIGGPSGTIVCDACGHRESMGMVLTVSSDDDGAPASEEDPGRVAEWDREDVEAVRSVPAVRPSRELARAALGRQPVESGPGSLAGADRERGPCAREHRARPLAGGGCDIAPRSRRIGPCPSPPRARGRTPSGAQRMLFVVAAFLRGGHQPLTCGSPAP